MTLSPLSWRDGLLFVVGIASGLAFLWWGPSAPVALRVVLKSTPLVAMGLWLVLQRLDGKNVAILIGLVFALLGDATLEIQAGEVLFVVGIVFNMLSLVSYTVYFVRSDPSLDLLRLVPFVVVIGGLFAFLAPHLGTFLVPVAVYCVLYIVFLWRSSARIGDPDIGPWSQALCFLSCLVITVSDSFLGLSITQPDKFPWATPWLIMSLWWAGQGLMTVTAELKERVVRSRTAEPAQQ